MFFGSLTKRGVKTSIVYFSDRSKEKATIIIKMTSLAVGAFQLGARWTCVREFMRLTQDRYRLPIMSILGLNPLSSRGSTSKSANLQLAGKTGWRNLAIARLSNVALPYPSYISC